MRRRTPSLPVLLTLLILVALASPLQPKPPGNLALTVAISEDSSFATEWMATPSTHPIKFRRVREAFTTRSPEAPGLLFMPRSESEGEKTPLYSLLTLKSDSL